MINNFLSLSITLLLLCSVGKVKAEKNIEERLYTEMSTIAQIDSTGELLLIFRSFSKLYVKDKRLYFRLEFRQVVSRR